MVTPYGFTRITARLWHLYADPAALLSADERRDWSIAPYRISGNPAIETPNTIAQLYERNPGKWRRELELVTPRNNEVGPINAPLLRFSDVLLMFAEADNMVNGGAPSAEAIAAVNLVRKRAFGKNLPFESLRMVNVTNGGAGYTSVPEVVIAGGGGSGATGRAFISAGRVIRVKIINEGTGYTSAPTITFNGGGGTGALATALLSKRQTSAYELTPAQTASQESFQQLIQDERSRELCFELLRKRDLVRWGKFLPNMKRIANDFENGDGTIPKAAAGSLYGALAFKSATEKDVVWPLSPSEMALNRELKPQNIGW